MDGGRKRKRLYPADAMGISWWASFEKSLHSQPQLVLWDCLVADTDEGTQDFM